MNYFECSVNVSWFGLAVWLSLKEVKKNFKKPNNKKLKKKTGLKKLFCVSILFKEVKKKKLITYILSLNTG